MQAEYRSLLFDFIGRKTDAWHEKHNPGLYTDHYDKLGCNTKTIKVSYSLINEEPHGPYNGIQYRFKPRKNRVVRRWKAGWYEKISDDENFAVFMIEDPDRWTRVTSPRVDDLAHCALDEIEEGRVERLDWRQTFVAAGQSMVDSDDELFLLAGGL